VLTRFSPRLEKEAKLRSGSFIAGESEKYVSAVTMNMLVAPGSPLGESVSLDGLMSSLSISPLNWTSASLRLATTGLATCLQSKNCENEHDEILLSRS